MRTSAAFTRGRVLAGVAVLALGAATFTFWPGSDAVAQPDPSNFEMERVDTDADLLDALTDELGTASVSDVVDDANRGTESCTAPMDHHDQSFCWDGGNSSGDGTVPYWMPQGITTSGDASDDGTVDGREVMLNAWYDNNSGRDMGVRVSFIDMSDATPSDYRHTLLVEPTWDGDAPSFQRVGAHAGGMAWYGDELHVLNTFNGVRVFDTSVIMQVEVGDDDAIGLQDDGTYHAHNYLYVLPQVAHYVPTSEDLRYSFMSLDRTTSPHSMVVGEFDNETPEDSRLARFDLDEDAQRFAEDDDGVVRADWTHTVGIRSMQGALSIDDTFFIHRSNGETSQGDVFVWSPGDSADERPSSVPIGPEDVTYWPQHDQIWSHSEYAGERYIYASKSESW